MRARAAAAYATGSVTSADGTAIGYRQLGSGQAALLVHGGMQAAQHFMGLAAELAGEFTVCLPDRRGRGLSGGFGTDFSVLREAEDMQAVAAGTGATRIFGLSSGALVALRTALATPDIDRVALYEPPLSAGGSVPAGWVSRYDSEIAAGKPAAALVTVLKGIRIDPVLGRLPRPVLVGLIKLAMRAERGLPAGDVAVGDLIPTQHYDMQIVAEMADTAAGYRALPARVLLMGGTRSPRYLGLALDELAAVLPHSQRVCFARLGHSGPDNSGNPGRVGAALREFFRDTRAAAGPAA